MKDFWVVYGHSESGDDYPPIAFSKEPSEEMLAEIANDWDGNNKRNGCGDYGSYVYLTVECVELDENLEYYTKLVERHKKIILKGE